MSEWFRGNEAVLWYLFAASGTMFVGSLIAVPWLVVQIPADYFAAPRRRRRNRQNTQHPIAGLAWRVLKNVLGVLFLLVGVTMLVLPGQGVLTMLMGVMLVDFPGKYPFERWLVTRPAILRSINWLRRRSGRRPLVLEE